MARSHAVGRLLAAALLLVATLTTSHPLLGVQLSGVSRLALPPTDAKFFFVSNLAKCLDVKGALADEHTPVVLAACTQSSTQRIEIKEVGPARQVNLKAAGKCLAPGLNSIIQHMPVTLRACDGSDLQKFVLDGDSIIAATNRDFVVEVRNGAGAERTQLSFGQRDLDDPEFWKLVPEDGTSVPTSGFVRVPEDVPDLATALAGATPGSVIQLNTNVTVPSKQHLALNEGVTLRGGRQDINLGPEVFAPTEDNDGLFVLQGEFTRITGLRVRGPSRNTENVEQSVGVSAKDDFHSIIDHNDISDWPHAAVEVRGGRDADCVDQVVNSGNSRTFAPEPWESCCARSRDHRTPTFRVRVARNFIHHNRLQGRGYGVVAYDGAYPRIEGNTFTQNRHAIAADGRPFTGYQALYNLVLSSVFLQVRALGIAEWHTQDFDVHGRFRHGNYFGSAAGNHTEILNNTFLGTSNGNKYPFGEYFFTDHPNFHLRGTPCDFVLFSGNISLESQGDSVNYDGKEKDLKLQIADNSFHHPNPAARVGIGDFDGDGYDDVFLTTGNAWYFAPRGKAEWRFLQADSTTVGSLLFGDFDGDGRTDVFTQRGSDWLVSWGALSGWEKIGSHPEPMSEYRIGQFDDDRRADIFFASGAEWLVSSGGTGPFTRLAASTERSAQVRLGDFNGDHKTDFLVPTDDGWSIFLTGTSRVDRVHRHDTPRPSVAVVADFDGDGRADVTSVQSVHVVPKKPNVIRWLFVSGGGPGPWVQFAARQASIVNAPGFGRFADQRRVDVLEWSATHLTNLSAVPNKSGTLSRQDMR